MEQESLTNKEKYDIKKQEKLRAQESVFKRRRLKRIIFWSLGIVLAIGAVSGLIWYISTRSPIQESDIISRNGFHWHPELTIYVKGEKQEISANIGLGAVHSPIHTHAEDNKQGIIHMEFQGLVKKQDTTLNQFFKNWGKDIGSFGKNMKMMVNGKENTEYEDYPMQDKDKIELFFE
jgi:hypothetical protein